MDENKIMQTVRRCVQQYFEEDVSYVAREIHKGTTTFERLSDPRKQIIFMESNGMFPTGITMEEKKEAVARSNLAFKKIDTLLGSLYGVEVKVKYLDILPVWDAKTDSWIE